jgi:hypothetical protein
MSNIINIIEFRRNSFTSSMQMIPQPGPRSLAVRHSFPAAVKRQPTTRHQ